MICVGFMYISMYYVYMIYMIYIFLKRMCLVLTSGMKSHPNTERYLLTSNIQNIQ